MKSLKTICNDAMAKKRKIHFLPPYRYDIKLQVFDLLWNSSKPAERGSQHGSHQGGCQDAFYQTPEEIEELERASVIGYKMHTTAMKLVRPGITEKYVAGQVSEILATLWSNG